MPEKTTLTGGDDDREGVIGSGENAVRLRVRYIEGGAQFLNDYLPFASAIDKVERKNVTLPDGTPALLVAYSLDEAAHPGMTNLGQKYLVVPVGIPKDPKSKDKPDLIVVLAHGSLEAMQQNAKTVQAVFAALTSKTAKPK